MRIATSPTSTCYTATITLQSVKHASITVSRHKSISDLSWKGAKTTINWPALGSVDAYVAKEFGDAVSVAAVIAEAVEHSDNPQTLTIEQIVRFVSDRYDEVSDIAARIERDSH